MHRLTGFLKFMAVIGGAASLTFAVAPAVAAPSGSPANVPFSGTFRICDFTPSAYVSARGFGRGFALVSTGGSNEVVAEVHLETARGNTPYNVRLIQLPRPSWSTCSAGDPGTVVGVINTDIGGNGTVTLRDGIRPGATGAWIAVELPDPYSQTPAENYTSDFVAAI